MDEKKTVTAAFHRKETISLCREVLGSESMVAAYFRYRARAVRVPSMT